MSLFYRSDDGDRIYDSVFLNDNGEYEISKDLVSEGKNKIVSLSFPNRNLRKIVPTGGLFPIAESSRVDIILKNNEEINLEIKIKDRYIEYDVKEGSKINKDMAILNKILYPMISNSIDALLKTYYFEVNSIDFKKAKKKVQEMESEILEIEKSYIKENLKKEASIFVLSRIKPSINVEECEEFYTNLDEKIKKTFEGKKILNYLNSVKTSKVGNMAK